MRVFLALLALALVLIFPLNALADSIDYQASGTLALGTAAEFGSIRAGHVWEVVNQLIEIDNLTTGVIERGVLGTIDVTSGTLFPCGSGFCFHGGSVDIDAVDNSSIFDSRLGGGTVSMVNGVAILNARFGGRVAASVIRDSSNAFSSQVLVRSSATVPEASASYLVGSGLLGVALLWRKKKSVPR